VWEWVVSFFDALKDMLKDMFVSLIADILDVIATAIEAIPIPDFMQSGSLGSYLSALPPGVLYFLDQSGLAEGMLLLASGFGFRMLRKALTLFQW
jgi:hypothetical protein